ncbi:MAG: hypothetical protein HS104_14385 [Polyangiaceae bacterium]|nr:hypothetical protein [Polyangiaceae bacterium]MCL4748901.1 hypothetical protein [Myxococcales bacterium]
MSGDMEHIVAAIPRPDGGELRVLRRTFRGSAPFTQLHRYYLDEETDELKPGKQCVTLRDDQLGAVIDALGKIARKVGTPAPAGRPQSPRRQTSLPHVPRSAAEPERTAAEEAELRELEAIF